MIRRPLVLVHHGVADVAEAADPVRLVVSPPHLESQLRLLLRIGYRFSTMEELIDSGRHDRPPARTAALTFDDGLADNLRVAAPLLARIGVRASFYVCPGLWGAGHEFVDGSAGRLLDRDEARELSESGMELGSHAMTHRDLRKLGDAELRSELSESKAAVEEITGRPCRVLAYPYGLHDARVEDAARAAGYKLGLSWGLGPWRPYAVPRMPGPPRSGGLRLALKLAGVRRRAR